VEAIALQVAGNDSDGEYTEALTDNYLKLRLQGTHQPNRWLMATVKDLVSGSLAARVAPEPALSEVEVPARLVAPA
jgi:hypothetical protein